MRVLVLVLVPVRACYLWVLGQVDLPGDVVDSADPLRRGETRSVRAFRSSNTSDSPPHPKHHHPVPKRQVGSAAL